MMGTADRGPVYGLSQVRNFQDQAKTGLNWSFASKAGLVLCLIFLFKNCGYHLTEQLNS